MIRVYLARAMTGRKKSAVFHEAATHKKNFEAMGFEVLCPVHEEGLGASKEKIVTNYDTLKAFWERDKEMIRSAHVLVDMTPHLKSEGTAHEIGYARYFLQKPVIRAWPSWLEVPKSSVAQLEDDVVCHTEFQAMAWIWDNYSTPLQRLKWRIKMKFRSWCGAVKSSVREWRNALY